MLDGEDEDVGGPAREAEHDRPAAKNVSLKPDESSQKITGLDPYGCQDFSPQSLQTTGLSEIRKDL